MLAKWTHDVGVSLICCGALGCGFEGAASSDARALVDAGLSIDSLVADADTSFDTRVCPDNYLAVPLVSGAKYRGGLSSTGVGWREAQTACADDMPGFTHLMVADGGGELVAVAAFVQPMHNWNYSWIGHFTVATGNLLTDGAVVPSSYTLPNPNADERTRDGTTAYFIDSENPIPRLGSEQRTLRFNYICECDGKVPLANLPF